MLYFCNCFFLVYLLFIYTLVLNTSQCALARDLNQRFDHEPQLQWMPHVQLYHVCKSACGWVCVCVCETWCLTHTLSDVHSDSSSAAVIQLIKTLPPSYTFGPPAPPLYLTPSLTSLTLLCLFSAHFSEEWFQTDDWDGCPWNIWGRRRKKTQRFRPELGFRFGTKCP